MNDLKQIIFILIIVAIIGFAFYLGTLNKPSWSPQLGQKVDITTPSQVIDINTIDLNTNHLGNYISLGDLNRYAMTKKSGWYNDSWCYKGLCFREDFMIALKKALNDLNE